MYAQMYRSVYCRWVGKTKFVGKKLRPAAKLEKIRIRNINICQIQ